MKKLLLILLCLPLIGVAQCVSGDCENGYGKFIWGNNINSNLMSFEGQWKDGLKHGRGVYIINDNIIESKWFRDIDTSEIIDMYSTYINSSESFKPIITGSSYSFKEGKVVKKENSYIPYDYYLNELDSLWKTLENHKYYFAHIKDIKDHFKNKSSLFHGKILDIDFHSIRNNYVEIVEDDVAYEDEIEIEDVESDQNAEIEIIELDDDEFFMVVERMPIPMFYVTIDEATVEAYIGDLGVMKYVEKNVKYPPICKEYNITGKVYVSYIIDKSGSVTDVKVVRGVDKNLDAEAVRIVKSLPKSKPGRQRGENVRVMYTIPINFTLN